jgi:hypothetical protein
MAKPLAFELTASPRGAIMNRGVLEEHPLRLAQLPKQPPHFRPMTGSYAAISAEAVRRNEAQIRSGFLDYVFAPDVKAA